MIDSFGRFIWMLRSYTYVTLLMHFINLQIIACFVYISFFQIIHTRTNRVLGTTALIGFLWNLISLSEVKSRLFFLFSMRSYLFYCWWDWVMWFHVCCATIMILYHFFRMRVANLWRFCLLFINILFFINFFIVSR